MGADAEARYLANDVILESRKRGPEIKEVGGGVPRAGARGGCSCSHAWLQAFSTHLAAVSATRARAARSADAKQAVECIASGRDPKAREGVARILTIWRDRSAIDEAMLLGLEAALAVAGAGDAAVGGASAGGGGAAALRDVPLTELVIPRAVRCAPGQRPSSDAPGARLAQCGSTCTRRTRRLRSSPRPRPRPRSCPSTPTRWPTLRRVVSPAAALVPGPHAARHAQMQEALDKLHETRDAAKAAKAALSAVSDAEGTMVRVAPHARGAHAAEALAAGRDGRRLPGKAAAPHGRVQRADGGLQAAPRRDYQGAPVAAAVGQQGAADCGPQVKRELRTHLASLPQEDTATPTAMRRASEPLPSAEELLDGLEEEQEGESGESKRVKLE